MAGALDAATMTLLPGQRRTQSSPIRLTALTQPALHVRPRPRMRVVQPASGLRRSDHVVGISQRTFAVGQLAAWRNANSDPGYNRSQRQIVNTYFYPMWRFSADQ